MPGRYRIEAAVLIHGSGAPISDGCVVIDGDHIAYAGPIQHAPPGGEIVQTEVVMPGMWDSHCHFFGIRRADLRDLVMEPLVDRALRASKDVTRALMAGFTSVREVGGLGLTLAKAISEGTLLGPEIYAAGSILSMTGGHADIHSLPIELVTSDERAAELELCDGVAGCIKAVRLQLRRGARVIKACASGGVLSELDRPEHPQFSEEELAAIVAEAGRADRVVATHCHGKAGIMASIRAGVRTIEHGTYLDEESARAMADTGTILVATRFIGESLLADNSSVELPEFARQKLQVTYRRGREALEHALSAGVVVAAGTDILTTGDVWGRNGRELGLLVEAGMSPLEAIRSATAIGPLTVGPQAEKVGMLEAGHRADVLAVNSNPLTDITVLERPESITHVWTNGQLVKAG